MQHTIGGRKATGPLIRPVAVDGILIPSPGITDNWDFLT